MMKHGKMRLSKIVDELISYCFSIGATDISVNIKDAEGYSKISVKSNYKDIPKEKIEKLSKLMKCGKQEAMEEYYWPLTGEYDADTELSLVGMMADKVDIKYTENRNLEITLYRYKRIT
jgi:hypothetical protein